MAISTFLDRLKNSAIELGAGDATVISTDILSIQDDIIEMCREPLCEGYGTSIHCPPHAKAPGEFRDEIRRYRTALLFKTDVDPEILLSGKRHDAFRRIYDITTQLEAMALEAGYPLSMGLAAGSCKPVFCMEYECQALIDGTSCRFASLARPSMEAMGINVFKLIEDVGWDIYPMTSKSDPASVPSVLLAGLVLVA